MIHYHRLQYAYYMFDDSSHILAIETSGRIGSVAIGTATGVIDTIRLPGEMKHAADLLPAIERLLATQGWPANSITDVFVSIGKCHGSPAIRILTFHLADVLVPI